MAALTEKGIATRNFIKVSRKIHVYPQPDGGFNLDNGKKIYVCKNADEVGNNLEQAMWPIIAPALKADKSLIITIEYETD